MRKLTPLASKSAILINAGLVIGIIALLLSYSRGAWLALVVGSIVGICIHYKKLKHLLLAAFGIVILFVGWLSYHNNFLRFVPDFQHTIFHKDFSQHLNATVQLKDVSNAERFYRWTAAINMIEAKPITGFGPNNFYDNYKAYAIDIFKTWVSNNPDHSSVHNYFLLTALEQGLVGLFLFVMLIVGMLLATEKLYHRFLNKFYKITTLTTGIIISMIIVVNVLSDLIETDKMGSLFWLSLGTIFFLEEKQKEELQSIA
ncbi:MAG: O-antigen ligase family protein [Bacteroidota bacterium]|nr:O-antigen ligase family protein [Bacteroidota bacterium]